MKTNAIKDLAQLSDNNLFKEIAQGLNLIVKNAVCIEADSIFLAEQGHIHGCKILRSIAWQGKPCNIAGHRHMVLPSFSES